MTIEVANGIGGLEGEADRGAGSGQRGQLFEGEAGFGHFGIPDQEARGACRRRRQRRRDRHRLHLQAESGQMRHDALARRLRHVGGDPQQESPGDGSRTGRAARSRDGQGSQQGGREQDLRGLAAR